MKHLNTFLFAMTTPATVLVTALTWFLLYWRV